MLMGSNRAIGQVMSWIAVIVTLSAGNMTAIGQDLPSSSKFVGVLHRGPDGQLYMEPSPPPVAVPPPAPQPQPQPQPQPAPVVMPAKPTTKAPPKQQPAAQMAAPPAPTRSAAAPSHPDEQAAPPACAAQALTCIDVTSKSDQTQQNVPVTFGQPFRQGDLPRGTHLVARTQKGEDLPFQADSQASFPDGSLRFAALSVTVPVLAPNEKQVVSLFKEAGAAPKPTAQAVIPSDYSLEVQANLYTQQISLVVFGNRNGQESGIPFLDGEQITLTLGEGAESTYTVTVKGDLAGGKWPSLTKIAEAFQTQINDRGKQFSAYKVGEGGGFERLWITSRDPASKPFKVGITYGGSAKIKVEQTTTAAPPRFMVAKLRPALDRALAENKNVWLKGNATQEFSVVAPFVDQAGATHPQLTARFNVRLFPDGKRVRTDVVVENDWAYEPAPGNLVYDVAIVQQGARVFGNPAFTHYHHTRWHKEVWWGDEPKIRRRHNLPYFLASRAVWNYDSSIRIPEATLAKMAEGLGKANTGLMGNAQIMLYMPTTGGRGDIGPFPEWAATYLISQDPRPEAAMFANADAGAAIPIHYRDRPTDLPVSVADHPGVAMLYGKPHGRDAFPPMAVSETPWTIDSSHQPSLSYLPYLLTGDLFYLDEVLYWASWNLGAVDPTYRGDGLIGWNQIRGQAWALRSIGDAAQIVPDQHPAHAYYRGILDRNLAWYTKTYVHNGERAASSIQGYLAKPDDLASVPPWQNDFMYLVLARLVESGEAGGTDFLRWMSQFTIGLWTHEADGYCFTQAPAYYLNVKDKAGRAVESWGDLFRLNFPELRSCPKEYFTESYPHTAIGYAANGRAALALGADLHIEGAAEAFSRLTAETPDMQAAFASSPTWAIVPRRENR